MVRAQVAGVAVDLHTLEANNNLFTSNGKLGLGVCAHNETLRIVYQQPERNLTVTLRGDASCPSILHRRDYRSHLPPPFLEPVEIGSGTRLPAFVAAATRDVTYAPGNHRIVDADYMALRDAEGRLCAKVRLTTSNQYELFLMHVTQLVTSLIPELWSFHYRRIFYFDEKLPLSQGLNSPLTAPILRPRVAQDGVYLSCTTVSIGFPLIQHTNAYHDVLEFFADDNVYAVRKLRTGSSARVNLTDIDLCENVPSKLYVRMRHLNGTITRPACGPFSLAQLTTSTQECDFRVPTARVSLFNATYGSHPVRWTSLPLIPARADRILSNQMKDVFSYAHFTLYEDTITEESSYVFYDTQNGAPRWSPETATAAAVYPTVMYRFDVRHPKQVPYFAYEGFLEQRQEISLRVVELQLVPVCLVGGNERGRPLFPTRSPHSRRLPISLVRCRFRRTHQRRCEHERRGLRPTFTRPSSRRASSTLPIRST